MTTPLTPQQIEEIRALSTPTISNAIECFHIRPYNRDSCRPTSAPCSLI